MEHFVWLMDQWRVQAGWRSASMDCGEQCVVITGTGNWDNNNARVVCRQLGYSDSTGGGESVLSLERGLVV